MRFGLNRISWVTIGLSSIALHLALLSSLPVFQSEKLIEVAYLPTVKISQQPKQNVTTAMLPTHKEVSSGTTQSVESSTALNSSLSYLRESLYRELDAKLKLRSKSIELLLSLTFSTEGQLEKTQILKGSGQAEIDSEVLSILERAQLYKSADFANLKIQVPVRMR